MRENSKKFGTGLGLVTVIATLAVGLVLEATPADAGTASRTTVTARWSGAIDTRSVAAVNAGYWSQYAVSQRSPIQWLGGSLSRCLAGASSASSNAATLAALNYVRSLAGLAPVSQSASLNVGAQQAALIMSANGALSHDPSPAWRCWSSTGAAAAGKSNLALSYPSLTAGQIVELYMDEPGAGNTAVGHRRWVLNPFSTAVGIGSTTTANALTVIGPSSSARPNPKYIGWPTAGYFPNAMEPGGRWSLSAGRSGVKFGKAKVRVWHDGVAVPVHKYAVQNGYGRPTIVWQMPSRFSKTAAYHVVVKNIHRKGTRKAFKYSYTVRLFTPTH